MVTFYCNVLPHLGLIKVQKIIKSELRKKDMSEDADFVLVS
jgi:hypothetical protein